MFSRSADFSSILRAQSCFCKDVMPTTQLAIDGLWQCLCPSFTPASLSRASRFAQGKRPALRCLKVATPVQVRRRSQARQDAASKNWDAVYDPTNNSPVRPYEGSLLPPSKLPANTTLLSRERRFKDNGESLDLGDQTTQYLYSRLRISAVHGNIQQVKRIVEYLIRERRERPNLHLYNALILCNIHPTGSTWVVSELLEEMRVEGMQPDNAVCHAVLKVLSVHLDYLLRNDILEYMSIKWYQVSEDGQHDVVTGLLREGQFELALARLDKMRQDGMRVQQWLYDIAVYVLCEANEIDEALKIMQLRFSSGELNMPRTLWHALLDSASNTFHHAATSYVWTMQVNQGFLNPSSGTCLNVLTTAARAGDAPLATDVFDVLSKRSTVFQNIHYELLMAVHLASDAEGSLSRVLTILTIMADVKVEPTTADTRPIYMYLYDKPHLMAEALATLQELHKQGRRIPIAALNLLIECYVEQKNLHEALKIYKLIHTLAPPGEAARKSFANTETINHLLKGCRFLSPPSSQDALFLASEMNALRIPPTALTFDRLILVCVLAASQIEHESPAEEETVSVRRAKRAQDLLDFACMYFNEMQQLLGAMPRGGTVGKLAAELAKKGDKRCWEVLQTAEDNAGKVEGWADAREKTRWGIEKAWEEQRDRKLPSGSTVNDHGAFDGSHDERSLHVSEATGQKLDDGEGLAAGTG